VKNDLLCFVFSNKEDRDPRNGCWKDKPSDSPRQWHICSMGTNSELEDLITAYKDRCPAADKRYKMVKNHRGGGGPGQFSAAYDSLPSSPPTGEFCPHCLKLAAQAARGLCMKYDPKKPVVIDSSNGAIHQVEEDSTTLASAKKLAITLAQGHDRPFTVFTAHTTFAPKERPIQETKHRQKK
jgi:hypothetical protein